MYLTSNMPNPFAITDKEALWDKVTHARLLELIRIADKVTDCKRSSNSYGEFRFLTMVKDGFVLTAYGHGIHERRETYIVENWSIFEAHGYPAGELPAIDKRQVARLLREEHAEYKGYDAIEQTERGRAFSLLADLTDEDGAWAMIEDMEEVA